MNKLILFLIIILSFYSCSFNKSSKFWTPSKPILEENNTKNLRVDDKQEIINSELNTDFILDITSSPKKFSFENNLTNNYARLNFNSDLENLSKFKFKKINNFFQYEPNISFENGNVIFFNNYGEIFKFNQNLELLWSQNIYNKREQKQNPVLQIVNDGNHLIVAYNLARYYALDIQTGEVLWSKINNAPFNSQIKIYKNNFYIVDFNNTLKSFSLKSGNEIWSAQSETSLVRSQKRLSIVILDNVLFFNNSLGDITAVDIKQGEIIWQIPTQSSLIYENAFSLKSSDLVIDKKSLFISNNKNQLFSIDQKTGLVNWESKINSSLSSIILDNFIITISNEGFLFVSEKNNGKILRSTNLFKSFNPKKRDKIKPSGFIIGNNTLYLTTNHGRLLLIDLRNGQNLSIKKISKDELSRPYVENQKIYIAQDNSIIRID